jgi:hypothetical protein
MRLPMERSVDHLKGKAEETREIGETMINADAKRVMLEIAAVYAEMAARAAEGEDGEQ